MVRSIDLWEGVAQGGDRGRVEHAVRLSVPEERRRQASVVVASAGLETETLNRVKVVRRILRGRRLVRVAWNVPVGQVGLADLAH
jgi:hypothetical protein